MDANPYVPPNDGSIARSSHTTTRGRILVRRAIGIPIGGVIACLIAEFIGDYFDVHGFRGNNLVRTKLIRAFAANLLFAIPYLILSSPLLLLRAAGMRFSVAIPILGGVVGVLVPRTMIGYGWEIQTAVGLDNTTIFFFAAGCGAVAGSLAEIAARTATAVFRPAVQSVLDRG